VIVDDIAYGRRLVGGQQRAEEAQGEFVHAEKVSHSQANRRTFHVPDLYPRKKGITITITITTLPAPTSTGENAYDREAPRECGKAEEQS
jgi:hypothetical protein